MTVTGSLMVCGTASDVGKSQVVTGLCRLLARQGVSVAPFKGQNMALNSWVTDGGHEIGRSQALQALAARVTPEVDMNPVLLKPTGDRSSQVIVLGRPIGHEDAQSFQTTKAALVAIVDASLATLRARHDVVLLEGAGSPAEPNLMEHDLVNLGLAERAQVPALLVCDIDRGGAFAALAGTLALLPEGRRRLVGGFLINKFRGDRAVLQPAIDDAEGRHDIPCLGILPHVDAFTLDAEDSFGLRAFDGGSAVGNELDIAVCRLPFISNFTDMDGLAIEPGIRLRYVGHASQLGQPDLVIVPGSKCTVRDLAWLRAVGLANAIEKAWRAGSAVLGICAGYQMLGRTIVDEVESEAGSVEGLGLLPLTTTFETVKIVRRRRGAFGTIEVHGYEIHHGRSVPDNSATPWFALSDDGNGADPEGIADPVAGVWGTSLHGIFEGDAFRRSFLEGVAGRRGKQFVPGPTGFAKARDKQIDRIADLLAVQLDLPAVDGLIERGAP